MDIRINLCRRCGEQIVGKSPASRVCTPCGKKRQIEASKNYEKRSPRTEYFREYHLKNREKRNKRAKDYNDNMDPRLRRLQKNAWWQRNAIAIKIKRSLGLKTIKEARAKLQKTGEKYAG